MHSPIKAQLKMQAEAVVANPQSGNRDY